MNLPFKFAAASANDILVLNDVTTNLILAAIDGSGLTADQRSRFGFYNQAYIPGWVLAFDIQADKDATVELGVLDQSTGNAPGTFYPILPVTLLAAGGSDYCGRFINPGFAVPLGGQVVPALKVIVGSTVILTGQIELIGNAAERDVAPLGTAGTPVGLTLLLTR